KDVHHAPRDDHDHGKRNDLAGINRLHLDCNIREQPYRRHPATSRLDAEAAVRMSATGHSHSDLGHARIDAAGTAGPPDTRGAPTRTARCLGGITLSRSEGCARATLAPLSSPEGVDRWRSCPAIGVRFSSKRAEPTTAEVGPDVARRRPAQVDFVEMGERQMR